jgi:glutamate:GABA antiporter
VQSFLAAPVIALLYVFGTSAILAFVPAGKIDVIGPVAQALQTALGGSPLARAVVPLAILCLLTNYLASFSGCIRASARRSTPFCSLGDHVGSRRRRFEWRRKSRIVRDAPNLGFTLYALAYLALFAVPVLAVKNRSLRGPVWLRALAVSGFLLTLLFVILSVFPIIPVVSETAYTQKTVAVLAFANIGGLLLCRLRPRRSGVVSERDKSPRSCP